MGNACKGTISISNQLTSALTCNDYNLSDGKWDSSPVTTLAVKYSGKAAEAISKDCAMIGPDGYIIYGHPDGTTFIIRFAVPYGNSDNYLRCTVDGPRASKYSVTVDGFASSGKTVAGTITISSAQ